jgi:hypothetical protein
MGDMVSESDSGFGNLRRDTLMSVTARSSSDASNQVTQDEGVAGVGPARLEVPVSGIRTSSINSELSESSYSGRSLARYSVCSVYYYILIGHDIIYIHVYDSKFSLSVRVKIKVCVCVSLSLHVCISISTVLLIQIFYPIQPYTPRKFSHKSRG